MKRQSKAEEALNRQLKDLRNRIQDERLLLEGQRIKIATLEEVRNRLEDEISRLQKAREIASVRATR
jgi:hypothetical protein